MNNITFVTAYYNIRDKEHNIYRNNNDNYFCGMNTYLNALKKLLVLDIKLIIFTEPSLLNVITDLKNEYIKIRKHNNLNFINSIEIITIDYEQLELYIYYPKIIENDKRYHVNNNGKEKFTPLYYLIVNQKCLFVEIAINLDIYKTDNFAWIDIRALNLSPITDDSFYDIPNHLDVNGKVRLTMMYYVGDSCINDKYNYYLYNRGGVAATFFVGNKYYLNKFIQLFKKELIYTIESGMAVSDEQIYSMCILLEPEIFNVYCGDYQESLINFDGIHKNQHLAIRSYNTACNENNTHYKNHVGKLLMYSHNKGFIHLNNDIINLLKEYH